VLLLLVSDWNWFWAAMSPSWSPICFLFSKVGGYMKPLNSISTHLCSCSFIQTHSIAQQTHETCSFPFAFLFFFPVEIMHHNSGCMRLFKRITVNILERTQRVIAVTCALALPQPMFFAPSSPRTLALATMHRHTGAEQCTPATLPLPLQSTRARITNTMISKDGKQTQGI
jgi:hypothetical protein